MRGPEVLLPLGEIMSPKHVAITLGFVTTLFTAHSAFGQTPPPAKSNEPVVRDHRPNSGAKARSEAPPAAPQQTTAPENVTVSEMGVKIDLRTVCSSPANRDNPNCRRIFAPPPPPPPPPPK